MKKIFTYGILIVLGLSSCETLVQIETPDGLNSIVVETEMTTQVAPWEVYITESQVYYDQEDPTGAESAIVIVSDDVGNSDTLIHQGEGLFRSFEPKQCIPGRTYFLDIDYNGESYTASSYCRFQNEIDTFTNYYLPENNGFISKGWYAFMQSQESEIEGDYYEWKVYRNDTLQDLFGFVLDEDLNRDVSFFNMSIDADDPLAGIDQGILPRPFPFQFDEGDTIILEQYCFEQGYYDFLIEVQNQLNRTGGPFDSPPANPISNISNGAYGYFVVKNKLVARTIIPE